MAKLTIKDWKKRALSAEQEIEQQCSFDSLLAAAKDQTIKQKDKEIKELKEELEWTQETNRMLSFRIQTNFSDQVSLNKVIILLGNSIPEKEYHNRAENVINKNQCMTVAPKSKEEKE